MKLFIKRSWCCYLRPSRLGMLHRWDSIIDLKISLIQWFRLLEQKSEYHIAFQWKLTFHKLNAVMLLPQSIYVPMQWHRLFDQFDLAMHWIMFRSLFHTYAGPYILYSLLVWPLLFITFSISRVLLQRGFLYSSLNVGLNRVRNHSWV